MLNDRARPVDPLRAAIEMLAQAWSDAAHGYEDTPAGGATLRHAAVLREALKASVAPAAALSPTAPEIILTPTVNIALIGGAYRIVDRREFSTRQDAESAALSPSDRRIAQRRSEANTARSESGPERRKWTDRRVALSPSEEPKK